MLRSEGNKVILIGNWNTIYILILPIMENKVGIPYTVNIPAMLILLIMENKVILIDVGIPYIFQ